jgi:hypothetical protein
MKIKDMIHGVLHEKLHGVTYSSENVSQWTKEISEDIKNGLKGAPHQALASSSGHDP